MIWSGHVHFEDEELRRIPSDIRDMLIKTLCLKLEPVVAEFKTIVAMVEYLDEKHQRQLLERFEELYGQEKEKNNFS